MVTGSLRSYYGIRWHHHCDNIGVTKTWLKYYLIDPAANRHTPYPCQKCIDKGFLSLYFTWFFFSTKWNCSNRNSSWILKNVLLLTLLRTTDRPIYPQLAAGSSKKRINSLSMKKFLKTPLDSVLSSDNFMLIILPNWWTVFKKHDAYPLPTLASYLCTGCPTQEVET